MSRRPFFSTSLTEIRAAVIPDTSFVPSSRIDRPSFHPGVSTGTAENVAKRAPVEEVVARHTAIAPSRGLRAAYVVQSIRTALPLLLVDVTTTAGCLLLAYSVVGFAQAQSMNPGVWLQMPALLVLQVVMMLLHQLYPGAGISPVGELRGAARSTLFSLLCLVSVNVVLGQLPRVEFAALVMTAAMMSLMIPLARTVARRILARTSWWGMRVLLIGHRDDCQTALAKLERRRSLGFISLGYVCDSSDVRPDELTDPHWLGVSGQAVDVASKRNAPIAAFASHSQNTDWNDRLVFQFPGVVWTNIADAERKNLDTTALPQVFTTHLNMPFLKFVPRICKRSVDLAICVPGLIVLAIPMAMIALAIKYFSPGPAIYGSKRVGQHGRVFSMWKFRSMVPDADEQLRQKLAADPEARREWEQFSKLKNDPRIIPGVGHMLRRWSLDELPQLWNVLVGEMSLVGPRPVPPYEIVRYQNHYYEYTQMWPGMTGLWQVSGRSDTNFETRVFLVHHYARNWSPWLDLWLLLQTPAVVFSRSGAY